MLKIEYGLHSLALNINRVIKVLITFNTDVAKCFKTYVGRHLNAKVIFKAQRN